MMCICIYVCSSAAKSLLYECLNTVAYGMGKQTGVLIYFLCCLSWFAFCGITVLFAVFSEWCVQKHQVKNCNHDIVQSPLGTFQELWKQFWSKEKSCHSVKFICWLGFSLSNCQRKKESNEIHGNSDGSCKPVGRFDSCASRPRHIKKVPPPGSVFWSGLVHGLVESPHGKADCWLRCCPRTPKRWVGVAPVRTDPWQYFVFYFSSQASSSSAWTSWRCLSRTATRIVCPPIVLCSLSLYFSFSPMLLDLGRLNSGPCFFVDGGTEIYLLLWKKGFALCSILKTLRGRA